MVAAPPVFDPNSIQRNIHFFRSVSGQDDAGRPLPYDPTTCLTTINGLDYADTGDSGPYLDTVDSNSVCCVVDQIGPPQRIRYFRIRKNGLPSLARNGNFGPLTIPDDAGLAEEIHAIFFANNIVGSDFNFFGPRLTSLGYYFETMGCESVRFEPLFNRDATRNLDRLRDISVLSIRVTPSFADTIRDLNPDFSTAVAAIGRAGESQEIELVLRPAPYSRSKLSIGVDFVKGIVGLDRWREEVKTLKVKGYDETINKENTFDILSDRFVQSKGMIKQTPQGRAATPESAYQAINEAYTELRQELVSAASAEV